MSENTARSRKFLYRDSLKWLEGRKGVLTSLGKPDIMVAPPPEFKGYVGFWTPEDMLISSVNSCYMMTFLYFINRDAIELLSFQSDAEGELETLDGKLQITQIKLFLQIALKFPETEKAKIESLLKRAEKNCFISNSIKAKVEIFPEVKYVP